MSRSLGCEQYHYRSERRPYMHFTKRISARIRSVSPIFAGRYAMGRGPLAKRHDC